MHFLRTIPRRLSAALLLLMSCCVAMAVLPENNVDKTVRLLNQELDEISNNLAVEARGIDGRRDDFWRHISDLEEKIAISNLVLLSQDADNPLGIAKATQMAQDLLDECNDFLRPIQGWSTRLNGKIARTRGIRAELATLDASKLTKQGRASRTHAMAQCDSIEAFYTAHAAAVTQDAERYKQFEARVKDLAQSRQAMLDRLHTDIFVNGNEPFVDALMALESDSTEVTTGPLPDNIPDGEASEWKTTPELIREIDGGSFVAALLLSIILFVVLTLALRNNKQRFLYRKRGPISVLVFFALNIASNVAMILFLDAPIHVYRAIEYNTQFDILGLLAVLVNFTRPEGYKLRYVLPVYLPLMMMDMLILSLINDVTELSVIIIILPIFYIVWMAIQLIVNLVVQRKLATPDRVVGWVNLCVMGISLLLAWNGHVILAIMVTLLYVAFWTIYMVCYLIRYRYLRKYTKQTHPITTYALNTAVYPIALILLLLAGAYWVADTFSLNSWLTQRLQTPFINEPDICFISLSRIIVLLILAIVVRYVVGLLRKLSHTDTSRLASGRGAMMVSLGAILLWLIYALIAILMLKVNHTGIIAAIGGASVGLGFALRDTIENFFYGITLMTGRARPHDIVECDDIRGYVHHVGIMTTSIETEDGPIVTIPNRQLFGRNFKNLTLNKSRELRHIAIDIDADNDVDLARTLMLQSVQDIDGVIPDGDHYVVMRNCGSGLVRMEIKVWIDTRKYLRAEPAVREAIFHAFNQHGIKISNFIKSFEVNARRDMAKQ